MSVDVGTRIGPYEVLGRLGQGGMGEVYRARDTKLGRDVALKLLPDSVAADEERRARFAREARALAALNHPNIVTIYGVEDVGGRLVIAMELVDGQPLSELVSRPGLPLPRALSIAGQVAGAIAAAHKQSVVHRDLKPANIMVGTQDRVKVLDFGLAKLRPDSQHEAKTVLPSIDITGDGRVVGTVAYMSPEQAEGHKIDERSDIFSFGVVLYEMITGRRPFTGDTSLSVLTSILRDTPKPVAELVPGTPSELGRLVRRCLEKDPDERVQSAADLRSALNDLRASLSSTTVPALSVAPSSPARHTLWWAAPAALAALGVAMWPLVRGPVSPPVEAAPHLTFGRLTLLEGVAQEPSMSPDGRWVVYVNNATGNQDLYLQSTTGQTAINLTKDSPANDYSPAFSPDGELIVFRSERDGGGLFVMGRTGESVRRLTETGFVPAWFPNGRTIVYASVSVANVESRGGDAGELWAAPLAGGEPRRLTRGDALQPKVSPNGKRIAYWGMDTDDSGQRFISANRDIWTVAADGSDPVRLTTSPATEWNPVWSPDGRWLYFLSNRSGAMNLWRVGIDEATGRATGAPQPLTAPAPYIRHFSLSADGRSGAFATLDARGNVARVPFDPKAAVVTGPVEPLTSGPRDFDYMDLSPDGRELVLASASRGQEDLFLLGSDGSGLRNLTNDPERDRNPRWASDGRTIAFYSNRVDNYDIWFINRDGSGLRQITRDRNRFHPVPSPDGRWLSVTDITRWESYIYDMNNLTGAPEKLPEFPKELRRGGTGLQPTSWSSDGRYLVGGSGFSSASGPAFIYDTQTKTFKRLGPTGLNPQFLPDDRRVVMTLLSGRLAVIDIETGDTRDVLSLRGELVRSATPSPDGRFLYFLRFIQAGDIWTVRFDAPDGQLARTP